MGIKVLILNLNTARLFPLCDTAHMTGLHFWSVLLMIFQISGRAVSASGPGMRRQVQGILREGLRRDGK